MLHPPKLIRSITSLHQENDNFFNSKPEPIKPEKTEPESVKFDYMRFPKSEEVVNAGNPDSSQYSDAFYTFLQKHFDESHSITQKTSIDSFPRSISKQLYSSAQVLTLYCQSIHMLYASVNSMIDKGFFNSSERQIDEKELDSLQQILSKFNESRKDSQFPIMTNELIKITSEIRSNSGTSFAASENDLFVLTDKQEIRVIPISKKYGKRPEKTIKLQIKISENASLVFIKNLLIIINDGSVHVVNPVTGELFSLQKPPSKLRPNTITDGKYLYSLNPNKKKPRVHIFEYNNGTMTEIRSTQLDLSFLDKSSLYSSFTDGFNMIVTYHSQNSVVHRAFSMIDGALLFEKTIEKLPFGVWVPLPFSGRQLYIEDKTFKIFKLNGLYPRWLVGLSPLPKSTTKNILYFLHCQAYSGHPLFVNSPIDALKDLIALMLHTKNHIGLSVIIKFLGEQQFEISEVFYRQILQSSDISSLSEALLASAMESMTRAAGGAAYVTNVISDIIEMNGPIDVIWLHHSVLVNVKLSKKAKELVIHNAIKMWPFIGDRVYEVLVNYLPEGIDEIVKFILLKFNRSQHNLDDFFNSSYHLLYLRVLREREWKKPEYFAIKLDQATPRTDKLDLFLSRVYTRYLMLGGQTKDAFDFVQTDRMFAEFLRRMKRGREIEQSSSILYLPVCPAEFRKRGGNITNIPTEVAEMYFDMVRQSVNGLDFGLQQVYDIFTKVILPSPKEIDSLRHAALFLSIAPKVIVTSENIDNLVKFCQLGDFVSTFDILKGVVESKVKSVTFVRELMKIAGKHLGWGREYVYKWPVEDMEAVLTTLAILHFLRQTLINPEYSELYTTSNKECQIALLATVGDGLEWDLPPEIVNGQGTIEDRVRETIYSEFNIDAVIKSDILISGIKSIKPLRRQKVYKTAAFEKISRSELWPHIKDVRIESCLFEKCKMPIGVIGTHSNQPFAFLSQSPAMRYSVDTKSTRASKTLSPIADETYYVSSPIFSKSRSQMKITVIKGTCTLSLVTLCGLTGERLASQFFNLSTDHVLLADVDPCSLAVSFALSDKSDTSTKPRRPILYSLSTSFHTLYYTLRIPIGSIVKYDFEWDDNISEDRVKIVKTKNMFSADFLTPHVPFAGWKVYDQHVSLFMSKKAELDLNARMSSQLSKRQKLTTMNIFSLLYQENPDPFSQDLTIPNPELYQGQLDRNCLVDFLELFRDYTNPVTSLFSNVRIAGFKNSDKNKPAYQYVVVQNCIVITPKSSAPIKKVGSDPKNLKLSSLSYIVPYDKPFGTAVMLPLVIRIALSVSLLLDFSFVQTIDNRLDHVLSKSWQQSLTAEIVQLIKILSPKELYKSGFDVPYPESFFNRDSAYYANIDTMLPYYSKVNGTVLSGRNEYHSREQVFVGAIKPTEIITMYTRETLSENEWLVADGDVIVNSESALLATISSSLDLQGLMNSWRPIWSRELLSSFKTIEELTEGYHVTFMSATIPLEVAKMVMSLLLRIPDQTEINFVKVYKSKETLDQFVGTCVRNPYHFFDLPNNVPVEFTFLSDYLVKLSLFSAHLFVKYCTDEWTVKTRGKLIDFQLHISFTNNLNEIISTPGERKITIGKFEKPEDLIRTLKQSIDAQIN